MKVPCLELPIDDAGETIHLHDADASELAGIVAHILFRVGYRRSSVALRAVTFA